MQNSFAVGSDIAWYHQMKDSRSGYSTKIDVKTMYPRRSALWIPIKFNSPSLGMSINEFPFVHPGDYLEDLSMSI